MGRSRIGAAARAVALGALTLACCEVAARVVLAVRGGRAPVDEHRDLVARLPAPVVGDPAEDALAIQRIHGADLTLHPFFGYTFRPSAHGANNVGFFSGGASYPYERRGRELVVGLFGGSVAMQVAGRPARLLEPLARLAARHGYERVELLSFAVGGWRQPQSFHALARYLSTVDVAIVLDGFNEVIHLSDWHLRRQPASYPWSEVWEPLARRPGPDETARTAARLAAAASVARVTRLVERPVLRASALVHLLWRVLAARYQATVATTRADEPDTAPFRALEPAATAAAVEARRDAYLRWWGELIRFSDAIAQAEGRAFFHFVQPNQYDRGAKPLSAEERELHTRKAAWFDEVTPRYRRLEQTTRALHAAGIESHFLGRVFAATDETLYVDDCCHLNARGIDLLAAAMAERIVASGRLAFPEPTAPHG